MLETLKCSYRADSQSTFYCYNIRSWVTSIDHPHFHQSLHYTDGAGTPCYNGNISSMTWDTGAGEKGYRFAYDGLNRLTKADYAGTGDYSTAYSYDPMGNLLNLQRYGKVSASDYGLIDNLNLAYNGNRLQSVRDNATHAAYGNGTDFKDGANAETEYEYDANGNLVKDLNQGNRIKIQYFFQVFSIQCSFVQSFLHAELVFLFRDNM